MDVLGMPWRAAPTSIDEERYLLEDPFTSALNVAWAKCRATAAGAGEIVIAADTIVASDGESLGKPTSPREARQMLQGLRGRSHEVLTSVALRAARGLSWGAVVSTRVVIRPYGDDEIEAYVARGEPFDKAGGYAVQDAQFRPVERCEGCYLNVVGLPLCAVAAGLAALGVAVLPMGAEQWVPPCGYCALGAPLVAIENSGT